MGRIAESVVVCLLFASLILMPDAGELVCVTAEMKIQNTPEIKRTLFN